MDNGKQPASVNTMGRFETDILTQQENLRNLSDVNGKWVEKAMRETQHKRIILDMDSSVSPVHGEQEGSAYNGHFSCTCFHPLFCFNQFGDCEGVLLRSGNVHSADRWKEVMDRLSRDTSTRRSENIFEVMPHSQSLRFIIIWRKTAICTPSDYLQIKYSTIRFGTC